MREILSLGGMIQQGVNNTVPDTVLEQCPEADRVLCENILMVAQAEIDVLNLASTVVVLNGPTITLACTVQGQEPSISLAQLRAIQAYSPARVRDAHASLRSGMLVLCIEIADSTTRVTTTDTEVIRVVRKRRLW